MPMPETDGPLKDPSPSAEAIFAGVEEKVPRHVGQLVSGRSRLSYHKSYHDLIAIACDEFGGPYSDAKDRPNSGLAFFSCTRLPAELSDVLASSLHTTSWRQLYQTSEQGH